MEGTVVHFTFICWLLDCVFSLVWFVVVLVSVLPIGMLLDLQPLQQLKSGDLGGSSDGGSFASSARKSNATCRCS